MTDQPPLRPLCAVDHALQWVFTLTTPPACACVVNLAPARTWPEPGARRDFQAGGGQKRGRVDNFVAP